MEGIDRDWVQPDAGGQVGYHFLPHGHYRFLVRAKNEQGDYSSSKGTSMNLQINPPFWKTIWFYLLIAAITGCVLFYLHRLRLSETTAY